MKQLIFFFILFYYVPIFSQTLSGTIKDSISGEMLPYVNMALLSKNIGTTTNENGEYFFDSRGNTNDSLLVSYIGYATKKFSLQEFESATNKTLDIKLVESKQLIDEVVLKVKKSKYTSSQIVGESKKKRFRKGTQFGYETCVLIENIKRKKGKLKSLRFYLKENLKSQFKSIPTYYRVKFYEFNITEKQPGKLLSYKDILIKPENKTQKITINLEEDYILYPINGICIGIETIKPSDVAVPENTMYTTAPSLVWVHNKSPNTWGSYRDKKWSKNKRKSVFKKKFYTNPLIQLDVQFRR